MRIDGKRLIISTPSPIRWMRLLCDRFDRGGSHYTGSIISGNIAWGLKGNTRCSGYRWHPTNQSNGLKMRTNQCPRRSFTSIRFFFFLVLDANVIFIGIPFSLLTSFWQYIYLLCWLPDWKTIYTWCDWTCACVCAACIQSHSVHRPATLSYSLTKTSFILINRTNIFMCLLILLGDWLWPFRKSWNMELHVHFDVNGVDVLDIHDDEYLLLDRWWYGWNKRFYNLSKYACDACFVFQLGFIRDLIRLPPFYYTYFTFKIINFLFSITSSMWMLIKWFDSVLRNFQISLNFSLFSSFRQSFVLAWNLNVFASIRTLTTNRFSFQTLLSLEK